MTMRYHLYYGEAILHACQLISYAHMLSMTMGAHQLCALMMQTECVVLSEVEVLTCSSAVAPRACWYHRVIETAGNHDELCGVYLRLVHIAVMPGAGLRQCLYALVCSSSRQSSKAQWWAR
jgi:hypothetical protein